ncbi:acyltransferase domain-containing protein [Bacillus sp. XF8]|uniref:acyltransferase domain-containing protein n=1 Tax=Bacillus sp. XF8 TaxID=2819289 RepID=UPI001AA03DDE|nr:acyltransferase domain-containing protein [Bacillus sp. XF8]MBO1581240.1 acyltransferase domain-containing protein [Bacillus sp. XF8]
MKDPIIFMFSGQGSQYFHMGRELYEHEAIFNENMHVLDAVFQKATGKSVIKYMYDDQRLKSDNFSDLFYTQPAIFMIEVALAYLLKAKGIRPHAVIGSSMGEYAAGVVADVFHPEDALNGLIDQVHLLKKFSQQGGMIAILASPELYDEVPILHHHAHLAAINNESHFVITANQEGIKTVERYLRIKKITYLRLPVTVPFHSPYIELASESIQNRLTQIAYQSPEIPFYSSVTGKKQEYLTATYFWDVLRKPIQFSSALTEAVDHDGAILIDLGPSGTLANLAKVHFRQRKDLSICSILSPYTDNVKALESVYAKVFSHDEIIR